MEADASVRHATTTLHRGDLLSQSHPSCHGVSRNKEEYPPGFYHSACGILCIVCSESTELATTFVDGGVEFFLETLEAFSSDQFILISCFGVHKAVIESLNANESVSLSGMTLEKLLDVVQLNFEIADETFTTNPVMLCTTAFVRASILT
jgi:hypothetical protein